MRRGLMGMTFFLLVGMLVPMMSAAMAAEKTLAVNLFVCARHGDDANDGLDPATPLRTVPAAVERALPGTTITLLPGWHDGEIELKPGVPGNPIVLRGARRGRVFLGTPPAVLGGWERAPEFEYVWTAPASGDVRNLMESSTGAHLRPMPAPVDVEYLAGTFHHDTENGRIYVHPSDSGSALLHTFIVPPPSGAGVVLADHTLVEDLVFTGFGDAAVRGNNPTGAVVHNCIAYGNGYAVELRGGTDCVISGNHCWGNIPGYAAGSQIYVTRPAVSGILIESNRVYNSPKSGLRFYSVGEELENCVVRANLIMGSHSKGVPHEAGIHGERNVGLSTFWAHTGGHNTYRRSPRPGHIKISDLLMDDRDWRFADPAWHDYRLQSDSPARGAAPDGSDLGAFQYDATVCFVGHDGDDQADGLSEGTAWRTLRHALAQMQPGRTLYIKPGEWEESLDINGLHADAAAPVRIRAHGRGRVVVPGLNINDGINLVVEGMTVAGGASAVGVSQARDVVLRYCAFVAPAAGDGDGFGVAVVEAQAIKFEHCAFYGAGVGVLIENAQDVELVSSVLAAAGGPQVVLRGATADFWSEYNAFANVANAPLVRTPAGDARDLDAWRAMSGLDVFSQMADLSDYANPEAGDFQVSAGRPASYGGRYSKPLGPHGIMLSEARRACIERVEVISTTRTSANITYWTPGRITGTLIEWGPTAAYGALYDRGGRARGEYETFHTVSLLGLEPETTYHFRVGFRDHPADEDGDDEFAVIDLEGDPPLVWSEDFTFTTAALDPAPRRLHVATDGDDQADGLTPQTAWRTLLQAGRQARAGDTVTIAPGRYLELLRPLQTGTGPDRRITFRAEKPLTVFLDGGFEYDGTGRSHAVQLMSKAFVTLENLVFEKARNHDNGGYRGWPGYAGLVRISGSAGIEINACVMEGRHRYMVGLVAEGLGAMPGVPDETKPLTVADSLFIGNWYAFFVGGRGPNLFQNNAIVRSRLLMAAFSADTVLRNNIYQSLGANKWGSNLFTGVDRMDSDYNCFAWDEQNEHRVVAWSGRRNARTAVRGLQGWQETFGKDLHGIEADPGYPLSAQVNFGGSGKVGSARRLAIADLILPPDSPCRGAGEHGADMGPRWEMFLQD